MAIYTVKTKEEFANVAAEHLFTELVNDIHRLDDEAGEHGFGEPDMMLILLSKVGTQLAMYTAYMSSGMYLAQGEPDKAVEIVSAVLDDYMAALKSGVKLAKQKVATFDSAEQDAKESVADLMARVLKKSKK